MAIQIHVNARNVDPQIQKLFRFEAFAEEHYKAAMKAVLAPVKAKVKSNAPVFSGAMRKEIWSKVSGLNANVVGRVSLGDNTWYGNVVEFGRHKTRKMPPPKIIAAKYGVPLNEAWLISRAIAAKDANARKPVGFFAGARETAFRLADVAIASANEKIVNEMAVK